MPSCNNFVVSQKELFATHTGIIDEIPTSICEKLRKPTAGAQGKNVILVIGDGMGWGRFAFDYDPIICARCFDMNSTYIY